MNPYEKIIGLIEDSKKNMNMAHPYNNSNNNLPPMKEKEKEATIKFLKSLEMIKEDEDKIVATEESQNKKTEKGSLDKRRKEKIRKDEIREEER